MELRDEDVDDVVFAAMEFVGRSGAVSYELGHDSDADLDEVPEDQLPADVTWYAEAAFTGTRISALGRSPRSASVGLVVRLLEGAACKCGRMATILRAESDTACRWTLVGREWKSGCAAPPMTVGGGRGDLGALKKAMDDRIAAIKEGRIDVARRPG